MLVQSLLCLGALGGGGNFPLKMFRNQPSEIESGTISGWKLCFNKRQLNLSD